LARAVDGYLARKAEVELTEVVGSLRVRYGFPWVPQGATGVVRCPWFLLVTGFPLTVTAEVAGSSPVVPAIHSKRLRSEWHSK
jgi:hypothetical protein